MKTKNTLIYLLLLFIFSCQKEEGFYNMNLVKAETYLKDKTHGGAYDTPSIILTFKFQNNTNNYTFFSTKQSNDDKRNLSHLYLLDTLKNQVIEIYSGDRPVIKPKTNIDVEGIIEIRDFKNYFELDDNFLNKKDFSKDEKLIEAKVNKLLNNSIILYVQDSSDIESFLFFNRDNLPITAIGDNIVVKVKKQIIKSKIYTPRKLKKLREIKRT
ncbi:hypothetical protein [Flavobacterium sp. ENC]|uniref:hypothetical protein n=1 Tax=Flavobacterium sp. ENC TaxID=2897330 RepID=UPI001E40F685|nr:hypothetical protein [Flavobacterium sp. ENC]MCD0464983.1 hypothetical protein [Flavobacterium sp. ENC]